MPSARGFSRALCSRLPLRGAGCPRRSRLGGRRFPLLYGRTATPWPAPGEAAPSPCSRAAWTGRSPRRRRTGTSDPGSSPSAAAVPWLTPVLQSRRISRTGRIPLMGWMPPAPRHRSAIAWLVLSQATRERKHPWRGLPRSGLISRRLLSGSGVMNPGVNSTGNWGRRAGVKLGHGAGRVGMSG